jgi:hypothetical protein
VRSLRPRPVLRTWLWYLGCLLIALWGLTAAAIAKELVSCVGDRMSGEPLEALRHSETPIAFLVYPIAVTVLAGLTWRLRWFHYLLGVALLPALWFPSFFVSAIFYSIDGDGGGVLHCAVL